MQRLPKRTIWLFFISYLLRLGIVPVAFTAYLVSIIPEREVNTPLHAAILFAIALIIFLWVVTTFLWALLSQHYYRFRLTENAFQKELGVLHKRSVTIPYENIQNVETDERLLVRLLGLTELRIETSGITHRSPEGFIPALKKADAEHLRDELIRRSHNAKLSGVNK